MMRAAGSAGLPAWHPGTLIATWFGVGLLPWAPGTWGSLVALPLAWLIAAQFGRIGLLLATLLVLAVGWLAAAAVTKASGVEDEGSVVVDEVAGQWLTLVAAPLSPLAYAMGFLLFRLFDIAKPWPVRWADRAIGGGLGVMADDVLAALYAALALSVLLWLGEALLGR